jgi:predicted RNase H-like nuclease (RuvC/YqgF family)
VHQLHNQIDKGDEMIEEHKILMTRKTFAEACEWIEKHTCLTKRSSQQPSFQDSDRCVYHITIYCEKKKFDWHCNPTSGTFVHLNDATKAKLKELYPKTTPDKIDLNASIASSNEIIAAKDAKIKELESINKVLYSDIDVMKRDNSELEKENKRFILMPPWSVSKEAERKELKSKVLHLQVLLDAHRVREPELKARIKALEEENHQLADTIQNDRLQDKIKELEKEKEYLCNCLEYIYGSVDVVKQQGPPDKS